MTVKMRVAALVAVMAVLGGCASPLEKLLKQEIDNDPITVVKDCFDKADEEAKVESNEKLIIDKFLDCFFEVDVPPVNLEWRLVRGHAVVAMISMYGAYSLKHDPVNQEEDAQRLFGRIFEAERSLWAASKLNTGDPAVPTSNEFRLLVEDGARHDRIADVGRVATASLKPAKRRLIGFFEKFSALFAAPTPVGVIGALKDLRAAARRAFTVALKGSDYIKGARAWMKNIKVAKNGDPDVDDWIAIDMAYLAPACQRISFMAYGDSRTCSPSRQ